MGQIQGPYVARVHGLQMELLREGISKTEQEIQKRLADQREAIKTVPLTQGMIDRLKADVARLQARLYPHVISDRLSVRTIGDLLTKSFDNSVVALTISTDGLDDLGVLKPVERRDIARILNLAWAGKMIPLSSGSIPGTVSVLWATPQANLARLGTWKEFHGGAMPVPILLLSSTEPMKVIKQIAEVAVWRDIVNHFFDARCTEEIGRTYSFTSDAEAYLATWEEEYLATLDTVPPEMGRHLVWLPALACRIAMLIRVTREGNGNEISLEDVRAAVVITKGLASAHLRTLVKFMFPGKTGKTDGVDRADRSAIMLAKIRQEGPLTQRELRRTYNDPNPEWFVPALEKLIDAGLVRYDEKGALVACGSGGDGGDGGGSGVEGADKGEGGRGGDETG